MFKRILLEQTTKKVFDLKIEIYNIFEKILHKARWEA